MARARLSALGDEDKSEKRTTIGKKRFRSPSLANQLPERVRSEAVQEKSTSNQKVPELQRKIFNPLDKPKVIITTLHNPQSRRPVIRLLLSSQQESTSNAQLENIEVPRNKRSRSQGHKINTKGPAQATTTDPNAGAQSSLTSNDGTANRPLNITTNELADPYRCAVDRISEAGIGKAVDAVNYAVDSMIANLIDQIGSARPHFKRPAMNDSRYNLPSGPMEAVYHCLWKEKLGKSKREFLLEAILHDRVCGLLFHAFFDGEFFFGIGSNAHCTFLESLFLNINGDGTLDIAAQRWRSMTIDAVFQTNLSLTHTLVDAIILGIEEMLDIGYPTPSSKFKAVVQDALSKAKKAIPKIVEISRELSLYIQRDIVSSWMAVTVAPKSVENPSLYSHFNKTLVTSAWEDMGSEDGDTVLGTHKFGLQKKVAGGETITLVKPEVITTALLRECFLRLNHVL
ncbi:hypothetical protein B0H34DRAFT_136082 [Crassisporium funariophilum]|nr:hypothetical protein B0H34DRAFT_136082 [Crassisporium funariophilum]